MVWGQATFRVSAGLLGKMKPRLALCCAIRSRASRTETGEMGPCGYWQMDVTAKNGFYDFFAKLRAALSQAKNDAKIERVSGETRSVVRFAHKDYTAVVGKTDELFKNHGKSAVKDLRFVSEYPATPRGVHPDW